MKPGLAGLSVLSNSSRDMKKVEPSNHEEADTRMLLHVADAVDRGHRTIMIRTVDTDVVVIAISCVQKLPELKELWVHMGTGKHHTYISCNAIATALGSEKAEVLPVFHALTGCDTVSSFLGRGKKSAFDAWYACPDATRGFKALLNVNFTKADSFIQKFIITMYDRSSPCTTINECRKYLFTKKDRQLENIPPTEGALRQHTLRAVYQGVHIWGQSLIPHQNRPCPSSWGWRMEGGVWVPRWSNLPDVASACLELTRCRCKKTCKNRCNCFKRNLKCTELCFCAGLCTYTIGSNELMEECEAELVLQVAVIMERKEAFIEAVGNRVLVRKFGVKFLKDLSRINKKRVHMMPVAGNAFSVIVCIIGTKVLPVDEAIVTARECFMFTWPILKKAIAYEFERSLKERCQHLLKVAKHLFANVGSMERLLHTAMEQARILVKAEACSVKMVDADRMELVEAPIYGPVLGKALCPEDQIQPVLIPQRRFRMNMGVTGQVLQTGVLINVKDTKKNSKFNSDIDSMPMVQCKTLLCFPIRDQGGIIGVGQLINKVEDPFFTSMDEEMALAFSVYCGLSVTQSHVYQKVQEAHIRTALAHDMLMYHMKVDDSAVLNMLECTGFHSISNAASLYFNPHSIPYKEMPCYILKFYHDLGFVKKFQLRPQKLARFILYAKKSYRDVPYHNWMHAFIVAQWVYAMLMTCKLIKYGFFTDLQAMMFLTAAVVQDIDHRGTTTTYQLNGKTSLGALFASDGSLLERHHLSQAMCILNTEGCDFLDTLPRRDYDKALIMLKDYILATDMRCFFKKLNEFECIINDFNIQSKYHISTTQTMLILGADFSDQIKEWGSTKKTQAGILTEYLNDSDATARGTEPAVLADRPKSFLPDLIIQFLTDICVPLYTALGKLFPLLSESPSMLAGYITRWDAAIPVFEEVSLTAGLSVPLSPELDDAIEQNLIEKARIAKEEEEERQRLAAEAAEAERLRLIEEAEKEEARRKADELRRKAALDSDED